MTRPLVAIRKIAGGVGERVGRCVSVSPLADETTAFLEREKGFEPSTSTLARWCSARSVPKKRPSRRAKRDPIGPFGTSIGHRGVGERVGAFLRSLPSSRLSDP